MPAILERERVETRVPERPIRRRPELPARRALWAGALALLIGLVLVVGFVAVVIDNSTPVPTPTEAPVDYGLRNAPVVGEYGPYDDLIPGAEFGLMDDYGLRHMALISGAEFGLMDDYGLRHMALISGAEFGLMDDYGLRHMGLISGAEFGLMDDYGLRHTPTN